MAKLLAQNKVLNLHMQLGSETNPQSLMLNYLKGALQHVPGGITCRAVNS
jgi:hypothetical protein